MQRMSARDAKNGFGKLIDLARAEPVAAYERLSGTTEKQRSAATPAKGKGAKA